MVTACKNWRVEQSPRSTARFDRQTPREKQSESPNRLQSFYRARYYDVTTGEFTSRDPMEYVDGFSRYRGYFAPNAVDPWGLEWTVKREGNAKAIAVPSDRRDTIRALAHRIGLNAHEYENWLTVLNDNGMPLPDVDTPLEWQYCDLPDFYVPNTMLAAWLGDGAGLGRAWVGWHGEIDYLKARGFLVKQRLHDIDSQRFADEAEFYKWISDHSSARELHGFFEWGHGDPSGFSTGEGHKSKKDGGKKKSGKNDKKGDDFWINFQTMSDNLKYKMGAVLLNSCESGAGDARELLVSRLGGRFGGHGAILDPSGTGWGACYIGYDWDYEPSYMLWWEDILRPGEQATK